MSRTRPILVCLLGACVGGGGKDAPSKLPEDTGTVPTACASATYETAPGAWTLPGAPADGAFARAERADADCGAGLPATRLRDLTGDGRPDLVALTACDDAEVGRTRWRVWPGADGGFGEEIAWALPAGFDAGAFTDLSRADVNCASTEDHPAFLLADLDGDGADDFVVTRACSDPSPDGGVWRVHRNTGAGFAAEAVERTPEGGAYTPGAFVAPRAAAACSTALNLPAWDLLDLDGDGPADIVVTQVCADASVGSDHWRVQRGSADGFAAAVEWPVPTAAGATSTAAEASDCWTSPVHFLADLDGDARPEMVAPVACGASGSDWTVWRNEGAGFAAVPDTPAGPLYLNFYVDRPERTTVDCAAGERAWTLADADADGWADLTLTGVCEDPAIGDTRWDHWRGSADGWVEHVPIALPSGYSPGSFQGAGSDAYGCGGSANRPAWVRADLDGDGTPEIVVTQACDDAAVGVAYWRVYPLACAG